MILITFCCSVFVQRVDAFHELHTPVRFGRSMPFKRSNENKRLAELSDQHQPKQEDICRNIQYLENEIYGILTQVQQLVKDLQRECAKGGEGRLLV